MQLLIKLPKLKCGTICTVPRRYIAMDEHIHLFQFKQIKNNLIPIYYFFQSKILFFFFLFFFYRQRKLVITGFSLKEFKQ